MHWPLDVGEREGAAGLVVGFVVGLGVVVNKGVEAEWVPGPDSGRPWQSFAPFDPAAPRTTMVL